MTALLPTTARALLHRLAVAQAEGRAPSVVAGTVRDGALAWSAARSADGADGAGVERAYRIGSITKTFTAVLVLQLRDEGALALTDPLADHVPGVGGHATLLQLLAHAGGLTSELPGAWWERVPGPDADGLLGALADEPPRLEAGARLHYSNVGFALLGEVVARRCGAPWEQVLEERLLRPLGLQRTGPAPVGPSAAGWAVHPHADVLLPEPSAATGAMAPAGELWSTVGDLARWGAFLAGDTGDVLDPATLEEMRQPAAVDDGDSWTTAWGLGLQLVRAGGRRLVGHGGSMPGFLAGLLVEPATGDGAVALTNATAGVPVARLTQDLLATMADLEPALPRPWRPAAVPADLLALTGTWYWGPAAFTLAVEGVDRLRLTPLEAGGGRSSRFRPAADGGWTGLDNYYAGERLRVVRDATGAVSHLDLATFVLTREPYAPADVVPGGVDPRGWHRPG
ncbi:serine hydrolase domain-containing protein [Microlunatus capsulatus]|uniref:CubicO group peptidase (Beta-lactamase class C family) n=1 Tax=Microlunatus capsulatus TaxID=99117 RepID=A0ABS4ZBN9_9ACTN|nr:serine hydrolase domain-containing protein [Microlunatus capsulatus]MBP2418465.1 CubicO group peptidase (beta-lactamase class C family) [Microlunatus capsulatus]